MHIKLKIGSGYLHKNTHIHAHTQAHKHKHSDAQLDQQGKALYYANPL